MGRYSHFSSIENRRPVPARASRTGFLGVSGSTLTEAKQMNQKISVIAGVTRQQQDRRQRLGRCFLGMIVACLLASIAPELAFAGASPFASGATAASTNLLA